MLSSLKGESSRATFFTVKQYSVACVRLNVPTAAMIVWGKRMHDMYNNNSRKRPLQIEQKNRRLEVSFILVIASTAEHSASLFQAHSRQMSYMQELQNLGCSC